jgi:gamma-glutamylcyclotransferase (GGCT)/AIG2-like uncharacterized protein YtfP
MPIIFVYGSLKKNKKLHFYLQKASFLGSAKTCKKFPMVLSKSGWYPYLIEKQGSYFIKGEVYKISHRLLKKLDRVEEVPFYYYRKKICVKLNTKNLQAWTYFVRKPPKFTKKDLIEEF